jgi:hypothetical protein
MSQPYLFVSDRCPHSKQIIETLKGLNKIGLYRIVQIESLNRAQIQSMPFLQKVPTLYHPETKDVVVGKDIFGYISKPTNSRKELPAKDAPQVSAPVDVAAWGFQGTGSLSEAYSDWNSPTSFSSEGNSMYTFLGGTMSGSAAAAPASQNTMDEKGGMSKDVSARLEALQAQRKSEFGGISRT